MAEIIRGKVFVVGDDIDTDQIIPAQYLSYNPAIPEERRYFGRYAMSGMPPAQSGLPKGNVRFVEGEGFTSPYRVVVAGRNFGCGSSREHAPLALAEAGCVAVVAQSYARIFYRNSVNGGYVVPFETAQPLIGQFNTGDEVEIDPHKPLLTNLRTGLEFPLEPLGDVGPVIAAGGIFNYARKQGMLK